MQLQRKRILVVGVHFDPSRTAIRRPRKLPQGMGPAYLAGAFNPECCDVKCYVELVSGPLTDARLLGWADMIVLTGLSVGIDRMLQITAIARTLNPGVIVVAGGPPVRILPRFSARFFDYVCTGDIEQLLEIVEEAFGPAYRAESMQPRFDLAYWIGRHGHAETSRNCNFACSFCSLTGEGARYQQYSLKYLEDQLEAIGRKYTVHFIDNNFYGNDRAFFHRRLDVIDDFRQRGYFKHWTALLTSDFYVHDENLRRVQQTGCAGFFTGVESFDDASLERYNKKQNTALPQVELMRRALGHELVVFYGWFADIYNRPLRDILAELRFIVENDEMMLPSFATLPIPLLGTPLFDTALKQRRFLPGTRIRDLDGTTVSMDPIDPMNEVLEFVRDIETLRFLRGPILRHAGRFVRRYRKTLPPEKLLVAIGPTALLTANQLITAGIGGRRVARQYRSGVEVLDSCYTPPLRLARRFIRHFEPTVLVDDRRELNPELAEDLLVSRVPAGAAPISLRAAHARTIS